MFTILFDIIVQPIIYVIELVFAIAYRLTSSQGLSIIGVSIVVNLLCLPLYRMADAVQDAEREKQAAMKHWVDHIKRTFHGDEQYMMLSAYYAEQHYRPAQAILGSLPLLLQIPFFMAAYTYLSHLSLLQGASFWFINDLGTPDGLLKLGSMTINLLPLAMTALNCASTAVYTRGLSLRDSIQAYGLAVVFLVLLYDSPAGLVFYWTCNQLFSLGKNVLMKGIVSRHHADVDPVTSEAPKPAPVFYLAAALLVVLAGLLVPSAVIADSPLEFVNIFAYEDPLINLVHCVCVWSGLLLLWLGIYFLLAKPRARATMACVMWCLCGVALVGYFGFEPDFGTLSSSLIYDNPVIWNLEQCATNLAALSATVVVLVLLWKHAERIVIPTLGVLLVSIIGLSIPNIVSTNRAVQDYLERERVAGTAIGYSRDSVEPEFTLSKTGKNVVVLFLDRALSCELPFIFNERPELEAKFDGFTHYPNTLSFGRVTNLGAPALYGGYEYTPTAMNERTDMSLKDKHDEALLLLPTVFSGKGYETTVVDPPYAGYTWNGDYSIYKDSKDINALHLSGAYSKMIQSEYGIEETPVKRSFVFYGLMRIAPRIVQKPIYNTGKYNSTNYKEGQKKSLINEWSVLHLLPSLTEVVDSGSTFLQLGNCTTHEPDYLGMPDYEPAPNVSREIDKPTRELNGETMLVDNEPRMTHFHVSISACIQLARWFDWMREQGVYDNTRIIIVSDHGRWLAQFDGTVDDIVDSNGKVIERIDSEMFNPLLMVKDFNSHGFTTSDEFMTNADVPTLALDGVVQDPVNPFTGKPINDDEKYAHDQLVTATNNWTVTENNGNVFDTSDRPWYAVHDNVFDVNNWKRLD